MMDAESTKIRPESDRQDGRQGPLDDGTRMCIALVTSARFRESNPTPLKYALSPLNQMSPKVRLPLVEPTEQTKAELNVVMAQVCGANPEHVVAEVLAPERSYRAAV